MRGYKTGRNVSQPLVISLKYKNKVTVKKFPFMKVQNNVMLISIPGGDFIGGEIVWWRDDQISMVNRNIKFVHTQSK